MRIRKRWIFALLLPVLAAPAAHCVSADEPITMRAWGVAHDYDVVQSEILSQFQRKFPHITPVRPGGLNFGGNEYNIMMEVLPLMQIASGMQPDVMQVWLGNSETYVRQRFFYPLDMHLERMLGLDVEDGHVLEMDAYLQRLKESPLYSKFVAPRAPDQVWHTMRLPCPHGAQCSYLKRRGRQPVADHQHVWAFPVQVAVRVLLFRHDLFVTAGLPDRPPRTWEELLEFSRALTDPDQGAFGLRIDLENLGGTAALVAQSMGGRMAEKDDSGRYQCAFDDDAFVEGCLMLCRMFYEPYTNTAGERLTSVVFPGASAGSMDSPPWRGGVAKIGMLFDIIPQKFYWPWRTPSKFGHGPVPAGPGGVRGGGFSGRLLGIFAGLEGDEPRIDAAWEWIRFFDGVEARTILAKARVEEGLAWTLQPALLEQAGYETLVTQVPRQWVEAYNTSLAASPPPQVGRNLKPIGKSFSSAVNQVWTSKKVRQSVAAGDLDSARALIGQILRERVELTNGQVLGLRTPQEARWRSGAATAAAVGVFVVFVLVMRRVLRTFADAQVREVGAARGRWQFVRYKWAYLLLLPAVGSIALWTYYPLARGTVMAFQDYSIRGFSVWVGMENFADVLFSEEFWYAMWVSLKYVVLYGLFGFTAPIVLAFLLTEVPRGKVLFRTIYYLPAVLSGIVVIFLWKGFYGPDGMINQVLNLVIDLLNVLPGVDLEPLAKSWLKEPAFALLFVMLPVIWVGMGPGCLIYLAALKMIPEELYEAADIDGAGIFQKVFQVAVPGIRGLIFINFIGVMVAQMKGGSEFVMAMTQGGPYNPYGETEVVGLHIYWQAFGFLRFGVATAMAWVLGSMLVGFTVLQLQRLSRMEFRAAKATG